MDGTVANARLLSLTIERFKSYKEATTIELSPLTVILGRNNSGKSSIIQALLLLKQTLALPRPEVPLHLEGYVDALNLREITYGRPAVGPEVAGPRIRVCWSSTLSEHPHWTTASYSSVLTLPQFDLSPAPINRADTRICRMDGRVALKEINLDPIADAEAEWTTSGRRHVLMRPDRW